MTSHTTQLNKRLNNEEGANQRLHTRIEQLELELQVYLFFSREYSVLIILEYFGLYVAVPKVKTSLQLSCFHLPNKTYHISSSSSGFLPGPCCPSLNHFCSFVSFVTNCARYYYNGLKFTCE